MRILLVLLGLVVCTFAHAEEKLPTPEEVCADVQTSAALREHVDQALVTLAAYRAYMDATGHFHQDATRSGLALVALGTEYDMQDVQRTWSTPDDEPLNGKHLRRAQKACRAAVEVKNRFTRDLAREAERDMPADPVNHITRVLACTNVESERDLVVPATERLQSAQIAFVLHSLEMLVPPGHNDRLLEITRLMQNGALEASDGVFQIANMWLEIERERLEASEQSRAYRDAASQLMATYRADMERYKVASDATLTGMPLWQARKTCVTLRQERDASPPLLSGSAD